MHYALLVNSLQWVVYSGAVLLGVICVGALLSGAFKVVTQIDDPALSVTAKVAAFALFFYLTAQGISGELFELTARLWGGADLY